MSDSISQKKARKRSNVTKLAQASDILVQTVEGLRAEVAALSGRIAAAENGQQVVAAKVLTMNCEVIVLRAALKGCLIGLGQTEEAVSETMDGLRAHVQSLLQARTRDGQQEVPEGDKQVSPRGGDVRVFSP